jgi:hypothetical protein
MKNRINRTNRSRLGQLAILVTTAFIALAVASPAEAGHKHKHKSKHHKQKHAQKYQQKQYKHHGHYKPAHKHHHEIFYGPAGRRVVARPYVARAARFRVPRLIDWRLRGELRPYYLGRAFSPLHQHKHRVYNFPVRERGRIEYRQHYYCEDRLYMAASGNQNGSLSFSLTF